jgi:hypothetical protein
MSFRFHAAMAAPLVTTPSRSFTCLVSIQNINYLVIDCFVVHILLQPVWWRCSLQSLWGHADETVAILHTSTIGNSFHYNLGCDSRPLKCSLLLAGLHLPSCLSAGFADWAHNLLKNKQGTPFLLSKGLGRSIIGVKVSHRYLNKPGWIASYIQLYSVFFSFLGFYYS